MSVELERCADCIGERQERCNALYVSEVGTLALMHAMDSSEVEYALADPALSDSAKSQIVEAAEVESVHLLDYRLEALKCNLAAENCTLPKEQIKYNLFKRLGGE